MKARLITLTLLIFFISIGIALAQPLSFKATENPLWIVIPVRQDMTFDHAWASILDLLIKKQFDLVMLDRENGYMRTAWSYTWNDEKYINKYRVRITIKFKKFQKALEVKSEAQYLVSRTREVPKHWLPGTDTKFFETLKTDIMGLVSLSTR